MYKPEEDEENEEDIDEVSSLDDDDIYPSSSISPTVDGHSLLNKNCDSFENSKLFKSLTNSHPFLDPLLQFHNAFDKNSLLGMQLSDQTTKSNLPMPYFGLFPSQNKSLMNELNGSRLASPLNNDLIKDFKCHFCSFKTSTFHSHQLHLATHFDNKCPVCDYTAKTAGRLERHVKDFHSSTSSNLSHSDWSPSKSPPAKDDNESNDESKDHTEHHSNGSANVSFSNNDDFSSSNEDTSLNTNSNNQLNESSSTSSKPRRYLCKQCNYIAHSKIDFWDHNKGHIKPEKQLKCNACNFVTEYKHHLEYHIRNHYGSKPFKCGKCNYTCVNKSMLNSHMKSHSNVYQFQCKDCNYATKYCHSLKTHLRKLKHRPTAVLNLDGTINPYQIIDVYGTRRGPRPKRKPKSVENSPPHVEEEDLSKECIKPEMQKLLNDSSSNLNAAKETQPILPNSSSLLSPPSHPSEASLTPLSLPNSSTPPDCLPFNSYLDMPLINPFKDLMIRGSSNSETSNPTNNQVLFWISNNLRMGVPFICIPLAGQNVYPSNPNNSKNIPTAPIDEICPLDLSRK